MTATLTNLFRGRAAQEGIYRHPDGQRIVLGEWKRMHRKGIEPMSTIHLLQCDRDRCRDMFHPLHPVEVLTTWHGIGRILWRTTIVLNELDNLPRVWNHNLRVDAQMFHDQMAETIKVFGAVR